MDQVVRAILSFGSLLWNGLDRVAEALRELNGLIRSLLDAVHVPRGLHGGIVALLWVIVLVSLFRSLPVWGRMVLVFCTAVMFAKLYGAPSMR